MKYWPGRFGQADCTGPPAAANKARLSANPSLRSSMTYLRRWRGLSRASTIRAAGRQITSQCLSEASPPNSVSQMSPSMTPQHHPCVVPKSDLFRTHPGNDSSRKSLSCGYFGLTRTTGLEPATTGSTVRYSNQLSYVPNTCFVVVFGHFGVRILSLTPAMTPDIVKQTTEVSLPPQSAE